MGSGTLQTRGATCRQGIFRRAVGRFLMFIDASAIIAIIAEEADGPVLAARLDEAGQPHTSAIAIYEAVLGLARSRKLSVAQAENAVDSFLGDSGAEIITITAEIGRGAIEAFERFGRVRHPARLNMGDCFA